MDNLIYFLEVNLSLALLFGIYSLTLRRGKQLNSQRFYLLAILPVAFILPNLSLPDFGWGTPVLQLPDVSIMLNEVAVGSTSSKDIISELLFYTLFQIIYLLITSFWLLRIGFSLTTLWRKLSTLSIENHQGFRLAFDAKVESPYSFFHYIVLQPAQRHNTTIITHEMAHARQLHSVDRLVSEVTFALLWINPVVYFWRRSLEELHEYLADREVVRSGENPTDYSRSLLSAAYEKQGLQIASCFNEQFTKKRLLMLQNISKTTSSRIGLMTVLLSVLFFVFACDKAEKEEKIVTETLQAKKIIGDNGEEKVELKKIQIVTPDKEPIEVIVEGKEIFQEVEVYPEYPGGAEELMKDLATNVKYPTEAREKNIQGRVFVRFAVDTDGIPKNFSVLQSNSDLLSNAAIDAIKQLKKWKPGMKDGKEVAVWYTIPINFKL